MDEIKGQTNRCFLLIIMGLPGTGKTSLALALAETMGLAHLNTDSIRNKLNLRGQYDQKTKQLVYDHLLDGVKKQLIERQSVVIDATLFRIDLRMPFKQVAGELNVPIYWVEVTANDETLKKKIRTKTTG